MIDGTKIKTSVGADRGFVFGCGALLGRVVVAEELWVDRTDGELEVNDLAVV